VKASVHAPLPRLEALSLAFAEMSCYRPRGLRGTDSSQALVALRSMICDRCPESLNCSTPHPAVRVAVAVRSQRCSGATLDTTNGSFRQVVADLRQSRQKLGSGRFLERLPEQKVHSSNADKAINAMSPRCLDQLIGRLETRAGPPGAGAARTDPLEKPQRPICAYFLYTTEATCIIASRKNMSFSGGP
jgi:hypothetical protein